MVSNLAYNSMLMNAMRSMMGREYSGDHLADVNELPAIYRVSARARKCRNAERGYREKILQNRSNNQ